MNFDDDFLPANLGKRAGKENSPPKRKQRVVVKWTTVASLLSPFAESDLQAAFDSVGGTDKWVQSGVPYFSKGGFTTTTTYRCVYGWRMDCEAKMRIVKDSQVVLYQTAFDHDHTTDKSYTKLETREFVDRMMEAGPVKPRLLAQQLDALGKPAMANIQVSINLFFPHYLIICSD